MIKKLLILVFFLSSFFLLSSFSSKSFAFDCGANGANPACPAGMTCAFTGGNPTFGGTCTGTPTCGQNAANPACPTGYYCSFTGGNPTFGGTCLLNDGTHCGPSNANPACPTGYSCNFTAGNPTFGGTCAPSVCGDGNCRAYSSTDPNNGCGKAEDPTTFCDAAHKQICCLPGGTSNPGTTTSDPSICYATGHACTAGGPDLDGKSCCPGTVCQREGGPDTGTVCKTPSAYNPITACTGDSCDTAIGNIPTNGLGFAEKAFSILLGISGAIALMLIIIAGYRLLVSRGNPEGIQNAREQIIAALVGLLFVIFSLVILQVIGYNILGVFL